MNSFDDANDHFAAQEPIQQVEEPRNNSFEWQDENQNLVVVEQEDKSQPSLLTQINTRPELVFEDVN